MMAADTHADGRPDAGSAPFADVEPLVARDKASLLYKYGGESIVLTGISSVFLALAIHTTPLKQRLFAWLAVALAVACGRLVDVLLLHPRRRTRRFDGRREITRFAVGLAASAVIWAAFPILFFSSLDSAQRAVTIIVLGAIAGGSATVLSPSLPLSAGFCLATMLPVTIMLFRIPGADNALLGILGATMSVVMLVSARIAHRSTLKTLTVSRHNEALVSEAEHAYRKVETGNVELEAAKAALIEANDTLERRIELRTADLAREIAERQRVAEAMRRLASTDPLTGLANRASFSDCLTVRLADAAARGAQVAVLFLDMDEFKQVNDVRGHSAGDTLLRIASHLMRETAGEKVDIARWGGDEFVVAATLSNGPDEAIALGAALRDVLTKPMIVEHDALRIDVTVGLAVFPEHGKDQDALIRAADIAMYEGKRDGRGRVQLFEPSLAHDLAERHNLEQALRCAIANGELSLVFQPIVSAMLGVCDAFEALLRWCHPEHGPISPLRFIPIAEQSSLIGDIGRWVLLNACQAARAWPSDIAVSVNVSVAQAMAGTLVADVETALAASGLPACRLQLEITESMFVGDNVRVAAVFAHLRRLGIRVMLDDFGTGFSSLACLQDLPIDVIKIDQSFIRTADTDNYAVIRAILAVAEALSLSVTAEGVEHSSQQDMLSALGIDRLQGFLLGRPMPGDAIADWLATAPAEIRPLLRVVAAG